MLKVKENYCKQKNNHGVSFGVVCLSQPLKLRLSELVLEYSYISSGVEVHQEKQQDQVRTQSMTGLCMNNVRKCVQFVTEDVSGICNVNCWILNVKQQFYFVVPVTHFTKLY